MICDAQVYPKAAQRQAQADLERNRQGSKPSEAVAQELEFRRWLRTYPRGSRTEWEAAREQEEQERRDAQAAADRRQLEDQQEKPRRQQLAAARKLQEEWLLDAHCRRLQLQRMPSLASAGAGGEV